MDLHLNGAWHPCAVATLMDEDRGTRRGRVRLQYEADYAVEYLGARDHRALSLS